MVHLRRQKHESQNIFLRRFSQLVKESRIIENAKARLFNYPKKTRAKRKEFAQVRGKIKQLKRKMIKEGEISPEEKIDPTIIRRYLDQ